MQRSRRLSVIAIAIYLAACHRDIAVDRTEAYREPVVREDPALAEQRRLADELASLEKRRTSLAQSLAEQKEEVAQSDGAIRDLKRTLERDKAETNRYIDQHETQVACAFAADVARGEGEYSEQTRRCARIAAIYCAVAMLSGRFRRNVAATRRYIDQAEERAQSLKTQIVARKKKLETQRAKLRATQEEMDRAAFEIAAVREKLGGLGDGMQAVVPRGPEATERETFRR